MIFYKIDEENLNHKIGIESIVKFNLSNLFSESIDEDQHFVLGNLKYLFQHIPEFNIIKEKQVEIGILTTISRQSGIGGSSSMIIASMWAIGCYCGFDLQNPSFFANIPFNRDVMGELSTEVENQILKNTCRIWRQIYDSERRNRILHRM